MPSNPMRSEDLIRVLDAIHQAAIAHHGQLRKGRSRDPYVVHPLRVMRNLVGIGGVRDPDVLCAAALHDVLEDTDVEARVIAGRFGGRVLALVREVTKAPGLQGEASKQAVIASVPSMSRDAQQIKLADVLANVRDVREDPAPSWDDARKAGYLRYALGVLDAIADPPRGLGAAVADEVRACKRSLRDRKGCAR